MEFDRRAPVRVGHLEQIDVFVTGQLPPPAIVGIPMRPGTEALYPRIDYGEMGLFLTSAPGDTQSWTEWLTFFGQEYLGGMIDIDTVLEEWSFSLEDGLERSLETYRDEVDQAFIDANLP